MMLTTLITGSPFGLGADPELKVLYCMFDVCTFLQEIKTEVQKRQKLDGFE